MQDMSGILKSNKLEGKLSLNSKSNSIGISNSLGAYSRQTPDTVVAYIQYV